MFIYSKKGIDPVRESRLEMAFLSQSGASTFLFISLAHMMTTEKFILCNLHEHNTWKTLTNAN